MKKNIFLSPGMMKIIYCFFYCLLILTNAKSQLVVADHRVPRDMSPSLTRPVFEEMPVYRIQLRITTGETHGAGSDNPVYVQLTDGGEKFYLVKGIDNFVEGKTIEYDVVIDGLRKVKHIDLIRLGVTGDDGVCIKKIDLLLNNEGSAVFSKQYEWQQGSCIDNGNSELPATLLITKAQLRASPTWNYNDSRKDMWRPATVITKSWIVSLVEATIGNQIYQDKGELKWGTIGSTLENKTLFGAAVEAEKTGNHKLHFDLDLERDLTGPNPEMDVDFDLEFSCQDGHIITDVKNVQVNTDKWGEVRNFLAPFVAKLVGKAVGFVVGGIISGPGGAFVAAGAAGYVAGKVTEGLKFDLKFDVSNPGVSQSCRKAIVEDNGNITLK